MEPNVFDQVKEVDLKKTMEKSYIDYAMSVIAARALPDVRDGLKPVQRRILYSMFELNNGPDKAHRKCARIVGDTMGKYHPHGDSSIYGALVNMAQEWAMRNCLVDGHGNFGSIDGDGAAAMRYTEARLSRIAMEMIADINKDTVDFVPNFDETEQEPVVLPSRFPNLLVNGAQGIAVGMATNIPPHNLREVVGAVDCIIENRIADRDTSLDDVISRIKGPDFPTGAIILGKSGVLEAYRTGRGKICVRAVTDIEPMQNGKHRIVVSELPYLVNKARLIEKIADLVRDKRVDGITDLRDESNREGMRIVIELRKDVNPQIVLNRLLKHTQLEDTFGVILLALVGNEPRVLNLLQMLEYYLEHQKDVVTRRTRYDLNRAEERAHILQGLLIALDHIDEVIHIIRESRSVALAKQSLMERFALTEVQAQAIVDMRLRALTGLEREKLETEYGELEEKIAYYKSILADEKKLLAVIKEEIDLIAEKYGDDRKTSFGISDEMEAEDLIPDETVVVAMTNRGYIKRMNPDYFRNQARGGKGIRGATLREDDVVDHFFVTTTHRWLLFFTNYGRVYRAKGYELPEGGRDSKGQHVANLLAFQPGEEIAQVMELQDYNQADFLVLATRRGLVKKTRLSEYNSNRSGGVIAINLRQDEDGNYDELVSARLLSTGQDLLLVSHAGQSLRFHADDDTLRPTGRATSGVTGMRFRPDDYLLAMDVVDPSWQDADLFVVTEGGYAKRTNVVDYPVKGRGGLGVKVANLVEARGNLVGALVTDSGDEVLCIMASGKVVRSAVVEVSRTGRTTQGVTFAKPDAGDRIIAVARNTERDMEEAVDAADSADSAPSAESADSTDLAQAHAAPEGDTGDSPADSAADTVALENNESEVEA